MADNTRAPRDIHLLTTDVLLAELVGGRSISVGDGKQLTLESSDDARAVLDWYRRNRGRWQANLSASDAEGILDTIGTPPPTLEAEVGAEVTRDVKVLRLVRVEAHRFAGLHAYGRHTVPPTSFVLEPNKPITLFEGVNGSGKTSIVNAIVWCLTGHLIRSQRPPEEGPQDFNCEIVQDGGTTTIHQMSAITPMPQKSPELPADGQPIPADSWVELTFADQSGTLLPPLRRSQTRTSRGKITETAPDLDAAGIDPIAWRIATIMPALLPFLPLGSTSQLGEAVARLTGLADLVDLAKHAGKMSDRIAKQTKLELELQQARIGEQYQQAADDLAALVIETPTIAFEDESPSVSSEIAETRVAEIAAHFVEMKAAALSEAKGVLGEDFDPENKAARDELEASILPAIEQLRRHMSKLPSVARLADLMVTAEEIANVTELLGTLETEAALLEQLAESPDRARRTQLYARVSAWMHEHEHVDDGTCPVCIGQLAGALDPITDTPVASHLADAARHREVLARTVAEWATHWCGRLLQLLPPALVKEARRDLPLTPAALLRAGVVDDLFATEPFLGGLAALKADGAIWIDEQLEKLPDFTEPTGRLLPPVLLPSVTELQQMVDRIVRALAFAEWRDSSTPELRSFMHVLLCGDEDDTDGDRAIGPRLEKLRQIVEGAAPLNSAIEQVRRMEVARKGYVEKQTRINACTRAAVALKSLVPLGELAQAQVDMLRRKLQGRSEHWRRAIYRNATTFAPDLTGTEMTARGVLELKVGREGVTAPAQHISNASALRGALLGFFLAFREHVLSTRGGLLLLVLDDPQELLDQDNRQRLARGLVELASTGGQLFVTSHDRRFARLIVAESRSIDGIEHLSVHPVNTVRPTLALSPAIEEVDKQRQIFLAEPDNAAAAQNYASDLRIFLETRLGDLFDDISEPAHAFQSQGLTLFPLVDRLRALVTSGTGELFTNPILRRFVSDPALAEGAVPRRVLNTSHHDKASLTYIEVQDVEPHFVRLRRAVEKVHEQFRLHRWREPLEPAAPETLRVVSLRPMATLDISVPICPDIAAFVGSVAGGSQDTPGENLSGDWFDGKSLFYVRGESLGFAIPSGSIAIVEAEPYPGRDQNLVIALRRGDVFARRMARSPGAVGVSLSALIPDPRKRRPTMTFDDNAVRLHRVVGAIFTTMPPPDGGGEATLIEMASELGQIEVAYCVREESAVPLALPGQIILGGAELKPNQLDACEGALVAVALDDGSSIFKRVGSRLSGNLAHLRQFETIGGLGSSMVIATEAVEGTEGVPLMVSARGVLGVLYDRP